MKSILDTYYWPDGRPDDPVRYFQDRLKEQRRQLAAIRNGEKPGLALAEACLLQTKETIRQLEVQAMPL